MQLKWRYNIYAAGTVVLSTPLVVKMWIISWKVTHVAFICSVWLNYKMKRWLQNKYIEPSTASYETKQYITKMTVSRIMLRGIELFGRRLHPDRLSRAQFLLLFQAYFWLCPALICLHGLTSTRISTFWCNVSGENPDTGETGEKPPTQAFKDNISRKLGKCNPGWLPSGHPIILSPCHLWACQLSDHFP